MPRKTPSTTPPVLQGDADREPLTMESHLATLERLEARQRDEAAEAIEELRQAWSPALTQAKAILEELSGLQAAYSPTLDALAGRDFSGLPPTATTLNAVAAIERTCLELQHHFNHTTEDLRRIISAIENLSERSAPLLHANATTYREQLAFYRHTPQGVRDLFQRLQRLVASLTDGIESAPSEEVYTPLPRLPQPAPLMTPEVEMA
jgi:DNA repair exonuclease SbcCD ATPase subunit